MWIVPLTSQMTAFNLFLSIFIYLSAESNKTQKNKQAE